MNIRKLEDLSKDELIELIKKEPRETIDTAPNIAAIKADRKHRSEPVAWIVSDFGFLFPSKDAAERYLSNVGDARKPTPVYAAPQPADG